MAPDRGFVVPRQQPLMSSPDVVSDDDAESQNLIGRQHRLSSTQYFLAEHADEGQNFTIRGVLVGLGVGLIICFSNTYFGLQRQAKCRFHLDHYEANNYQRLGKQHEHALVLDRVRLF